MTIIKDKDFIALTNKLDESIKLVAKLEKDLKQSQKEMKRWRALTSRWEAVADKWLELHERTLANELKRLEKLSDSKT